MNASTSRHIAVRPSGALPGIFAAGLLAGVLDITAAFVTWAPQGVPPVNPPGNCKRASRRASVQRRDTNRSAGRGAAFSDCAFSGGGFLCGEPEN